MKTAPKLEIIDGELKLGGKSIDPTYVSWYEIKSSADGKPTELLISVIISL